MDVGGGAMPGARAGVRAGRVTASLILPFPQGEGTQGLSECGLFTALLRN